MPNSNNGSNNAVAVRQAGGFALQSIGELKEMGTILAESKMFGSAKPAECLVIAGMCQQEGISWMEFMRKYHMVEGRVTMRADAMLAEFHRRGGKEKIVRRDEGGSVAEFFYNGNSYTFKCLWDEVKNDAFCNTFDRDTGKTVVKSNYRDGRKRMQMLWARCVSDAIRAICPEVNSGCYTPEEAADFDAAPATRQAAAPVVSVTTPTPTLQAPAIEEPEIVDAEPLPVADNSRMLAEDAGEMPDSPEVDISVCPVPGQYFGRKWDEMDTRSLSAIRGVAKKYPQITADHLDYVDVLLASRKDGE